MSGVLERMVQRTRGTLAAAEPRIAASTLPRQASSSAVNADWLGEVHVQVEGGLRTADWRSASASNASVAAIGNRPASIDAHKASQLPGRSNRAAELSESPSPLTTRQPATPGGEEAPKAHGVKREATVSTPVMEDSSSPEPEQSDAADGPSRDSMPIVHSAPQLKEQSSRPSAGERMSVVDDDLAEPRAAVDDRLQIVHEHREISISIGTVSMQSTPQPAPRVAPAFRPRVSLDAFLERRQGSR